MDARCNAFQVSAEIGLTRLQCNFILDIMDWGGVLINLYAHFFEDLFESVDVDAKLE